MVLRMYKGCGDCTMLLRIVQWMDGMYNGCREGTKSEACSGVEVGLGSGFNEP